MSSRESRAINARRVWFCALRRDAESAAIGRATAPELRDTTWASMSAAFAIFRMAVAIGWPAEVKSGIRQECPLGSTPRRSSGPPWRQDPQCSTRLRAWRQRHRTLDWANGHEHHAGPWCFSPTPARLGRAVGRARARGHDLLDMRGAWPDGTAATTWRVVRSNLDVPRPPPGTTGARPRLGAVLGLPQGERLALRPPQRSFPSGPAGCQLHGRDQWRRQSSRRAPTTLWGRSWSRRR